MDKDNSPEDKNTFANQKARLSEAVDRMRERIEQNNRKLTEIEQALNAKSLHSD